MGVLYDFATCAGVRKIQTASFQTQKIGSKCSASTLIAAC